jgi:predicted metal-binding membrane protein
VSDGGAAAVPRAPSSATARTYVAAAVTIVAAAALTVWMCTSMAGAMPMAGGWELSMAWMPMPMDASGAQAWAGATAMFLAMWLAMMVAMMLPSALPLLMVYERTLRFRRDSRAFAKTALAAAGYFTVWLALGALAFAGGVALTQAALASETVSRAVPVLGALVLIAAGIYQLTALKAACLNHCRGPVETLAAHMDRGAFRLGVHHGLRCAGCCAGIMAVQLVLGVMNLAAMAALAAWIAIEKLTPLGPALARASGVVAIGAGTILLL